MDTTINRGYVYPQCEPPLVEDEANAPVQTRLLAEAIDADLDTVDALIDYTYQLDTTILTLAAPTFLNSGDAIPFDTVEFDAQGWASLPGITVTDAGLYLVTAFVEDGAGDCGTLMVQFTNDGNGFYLQGTSPAALANGRMSANGITILQAGVTLGARLTYIGTTPSFQNARLSATRMVRF
jgi:hypothetical protein